MTTIYSLPNDHAKNKRVIYNLVELQRFKWSLVQRPNGRNRKSTNDRAESLMRSGLIKVSQRQLQIHFYTTRVNYELRRHRQGANTLKWIRVYGSYGCLKSALYNFVYEQRLRLLCNFIMQCRIFSGLVLLPLMHLLRFIHDFFCVFVLLLAASRIHSDTSSTPIPGFS